MGGSEDNPLEEHREGKLAERTSLYELRRWILTSDMQYESRYCELVIFSRDGLLRPDFIHTALAQVDPDVEDIRQHWTGRSAEARNVFAGGCTAELYCDPAAVHRVTKELQFMSRSVIAVSFSAFFRALVEAEIRHPYYEGGYTRLAIKGKEELPSHEKVRLEYALVDFGPCKNIKFHTPSGDYGTVCTVMYQFAAHAIAAKTVLNGKEFHVTGRISVQLQTTQKVKDILGFVKEYLV